MGSRPRSPRWIPRKSSWRSCTASNRRRRRIAGRPAGTSAPASKSRATSRRPVSITKALDALLPPRRTRRRAAPASGEPAPTPPGAALASGLIWSPVAGRVLMHEANPGGVRINTDRDGDWSGVAATGWVVHSAAPAVFASLDDARAGLLEGPRLHSDCADVLSSRRCIAVADNGWAGTASGRSWPRIGHCGTPSRPTSTRRTPRMPHGRWWGSPTDCCRRRRAGPAPRAGSV